MSDATILQSEKAINGKAGLHVLLANTCLLAGNRGSIEERFVLARVSYVIGF